ncbi:MAG: hypothetical protein AAF390_00095 [Pseudomonadota bacterium]
MASRRHVLAGLGAAALTGCGFTPAYGPENGAIALRGAVLAAEPDDETDFAFVRQMEERLGAPNDPRFDLTYRIRVRRRGLGVLLSNDITRFNLEGRMNWTLSEIDGGGTTLRGREIAFTGYSAGISTLSTLESERDARRRLAALLADRVVARLLAEVP